MFLLLGRLSGLHVFLAAPVLYFALMFVGAVVRGLSDVDYEDHYMDGSFIDVHHSY